MINVMPRIFEASPVRPPEDRESIATDLVTRIATIPSGAILAIALVFPFQALLP